MKRVRQKLNAIADRVRRQERAAGGRSDRARYDLGADHPDGARRAARKRVFRLGGAAGALSRTSTASTCRRRANERATGRTEEIAAYIGADRLIYQDLPDLIEAAHEGNPKITRFDASCFDGVYVTGDVNRDYLDRIERSRCDDAKNRRQGSSSGDVAYAEVLTFPR